MTFLLIECTYTYIWGAGAILVRPLTTCPRADVENGGGGIKTITTMTGGVYNIGGGGKVRNDVNKMN